MTGSDSVILILVVISCFSLVSFFAFQNGLVVMTVIMNCYSSQPVSVLGISVSLYGTVSLSVFHSYAYISRI